MIHRLQLMLVRSFLVLGAAMQIAAAQQAPALVTTNAADAPRMVDAFRVEVSTAAPRSDSSVPNGLAIMGAFGTTLVIGAFIAELRRRRAHERRRRRY
jgi:hypothetical protein